VASNVVEILVKSTNDTKAGFSSAKRDAEIAGDEAGQGFVNKFAARMFGLTGGGGGGGGTPGFIEMFGKQFAGLASGALVIAPAIAAAVVEIVGLVNGLVAAGAGLGALALVAIPTFEKVKKALGDTPAELKKQPPIIQEIVGKVNGLKDSFGKIGQAMQPQLLGIFNQGLGIAAQLMPVIAQFAKAAAPAVSEVMKQLSKAIDSKGFKDFVDKFSKLSGPAIEAIGSGFIKVAGAVGHLLTVMSAHDVVHAINIAFGILAGTINLFASWVSGAMRNWDRFSGAIREGWKNIVQWTRDAKNDIHGVFDLIGRLFTTDPANWITSAVNWFKSLPGKIVAALSGLGGMLFSAGQHAVQRLIDGLGSMLGSLGHMAASLASKIAGFFGLSPAVEGPLSGGGAPEVRGRHFAAALAAGIASGVPQAGAAAGRLAGDIGTITGGGIVPGGGGVLRVQLEFAGGDGPIIEAFKNAIRVRGGGGPNSVQLALGQGRF
jgi:hypothetical protein